METNCILAEQGGGEITYRFSARLAAGSVPHSNFYDRRATDQQLVPDPFACMISISMNYILRKEFLLPSTSYCDNDTDRMNLQ